MICIYIFSILHSIPYVYIKNPENFSGFFVKVTSLYVRRPNPGGLFRSSAVAVTVAAMTATAVTIAITAMVAFAVMTTVTVTVATAVTIAIAAAAISGGFCKRT